ncbi:ABC transporter permease [Nocardioides sp. AE5]|uniref:branched-chain amino acid ABC transporter permease n=1 Tax=Nocardioides sp. AE5 TaxID=2962573 RepID=UPI0028815054|nr:ABC transporter permease [Nocardioides sp. AE5]MDT0202248.1 ABC transporter permease [Nocardioides sp. AE5]
MSSLFAFTILGLFTGAAYAIAASGLVLTYTTTRVFNIAHGAFGMVLAFTFWDFSVRQGLPTWLALVLVLFVVAPAIGWFISKFVTKGLGEGPVSVALVVTVGMLVGLIGVAQYIWPPESRVLESFLPEQGWALGGTYVTGHQAITILLSGLVAICLYLLLNRTRIGTAMRAAVDNPELLKLFGGKPETVAALSWAIGISLAALAGILLAPVVGLEYYQLTLLVINAYAAAMLGRLKSLPWTFVGAMTLGILESYAVAYLPTDGFWSGIRPVIPALFLFVVLVAMPQAHLRIGQVKGIVSAPVPSLQKSLSWGMVLFLLVGCLTMTMPDSDLLLVGTAATYAIVMLSLVLLTGYGGHVSLAQFTFAGVGALAYAKLDMPNLTGLLLAALVAAAVGALVAVPVLRLTGLYLALATMAFAVLMEKMLFQDERAFGYNGVLEAGRLEVFGLQFSSIGAHVMVMTAALILISVGLLAMRRGVLGRVLIAMRDSPAACGTLGLDMRWFRVGLFAMSAGIAGIAGALFAGLRGTIGATDFQFFNSLTLLLLVVVFGMTSVTGAVLGGVGLMLLPVLQSQQPELAGLFFALLGFGAVALGRDPNGLSNLFFRFGRWLRVMAAPHLKLPVLASREELVAAGAEHDEEYVDDPLVDDLLDAPAGEEPARVTP